MSSLSYERRCAVEKAWKNEREKVLESKGSRDWTPEEQNEIIQTGKCYSYQGHHMISVQKAPEQAGNPKNIQFLNHDEHFSAHNGNWRTPSNGYYNPKTGKTEPFANNEPSVKYKKLSNPSYKQSVKSDNKEENSGSDKKGLHKLPVNKSEGNNRNSDRKAQFAKVQNDNSLQNHKSNSNEKPNSNSMNN